MKWVEIKAEEQLSRGATAQAALVRRTSKIAAKAGTSVVK